MTLHLCGECFAFVSIFLAQWAVQLCMPSVAEEAVAASARALQAAQAGRDEAARAEADEIAYAQHRSED
jgi:hypothetical protein